MLKPSFLITSVLATALALTGCSSSGSKTQGGAKKGDKDARRAIVVAKIGKRIITVGELEDTLNAQPQFARMRFSSPERKKVFLEKLVRLEVLVAEAKKRGLEKHPEVRRRVKSVLVNKLMKQLNQELVKFGDITEAEIKARFEKDIKKYQSPVKVQAVKIVVKTKAEADKLLPTIKKIRGAKDLAPLVAKQSIDPQAKKGGGNMGYFAKNNKKLPPELVAAAFELPAVGAVSEPVKVKEGFAILVLVGKQPARNRSFASVKNIIKDLLFKERRFSSVKSYADKLKEKAKIEIFDAELKKVEVKMIDDLKIPKGTLVFPKTKKGTAK